MLPLMLFYTVKGKSFVYTVYLKKLDIVRLSSINHIFAKYSNIVIYASNSNVAKCVI